MSDSTRWSRRDLLGVPIALAVGGSRAPGQTPSAQPPTDFTSLPPNLPRPQDDGGARHLKGMAIPDLELTSTSDRRVNLSKVRTAPRVIVYAYPRTGVPGQPSPQGW